MELKVGKWYTSKTWMKDSFIEYDGKEKDYVSGLGIIASSPRSNFLQYRNRWTKRSDIREATLEELKKYLPKDYKFNNEIEYEIY